LITQESLEKFAGLGTGQVLFKVNRFRCLVARQVLAYVVNEFIRQLGRCSKSLDEFNCGLYLFAHVLVGHSNYSGVGHARMRHQDAFNLRGIDVHATTDDHVDLAIA
jgi:hypothetical protein